MFIFSKYKKDKLEKIISLFFEYYEFGVFWNGFYKYNIIKMNLYSIYNIKDKIHNFNVDIYNTKNEKFSFTFTHDIYNRLFEHDNIVIIINFLNYTDKKGFQIDVMFKNKISFCELISYYTMKDIIIEMMKNGLNEYYIYLCKKNKLEHTNNINTWIQKGILVLNDKG